MAAAVLLVSATACGGSGGSTAVGTKTQSPRQGASTGASVETIEQFRTFVEGSPFLGGIDWEPPRTLEQWATLARGAVTGTIEGAERSAPVNLFAKGDPRLGMPNAATTVRVGISLIVRLDGSGAQGRRALDGADTMRVRLDLWTGQRDQTGLSEPYIERVLAHLPVGSRVVVPIANAEADSSEFVPLLGTPLIADPGGRLLAIDGRVDAIFEGLSADDARERLDPS
jgi:hypothetical protein